MNTRSALHPNSQEVLDYIATRPEGCDVGEVVLHTHRTADSVRNSLETLYARGLLRRDAGVYPQRWTAVQA